MRCKCWSRQESMVVEPPCSEFHQTAFGTSPFKRIVAVYNAENGGIAPVIAIVTLIQCLDLFTPLLSRVPALHIVDRLRQNVKEASAPSHGRVHARMRSIPASPAALNTDPVTSRNHSSTTCLCRLSKQDGVPLGLRPKYLEKSPKSQNQGHL